LNFNTAHRLFDAKFPRQIQHGLQSLKRAHNPPYLKTTPPRGNQQTAPVPMVLPEYRIAG
jgi:hypothetical protein